MIAIIQHRAEKRPPSYCCFIDYTTAYPSVHRDRLALILNDNNIKGKCGTSCGKTPSECAYESYTLSYLPAAKSP